MNLTEQALFVDVPMDLDAERQILGILIKYPGQVDAVVDRLRAVHFYDLAHRHIYQIILDLYNKQGRISYTQIYNRLRGDSITDSPAELLISLTESFVALSELEPSISSLVHKEGIRRLIKACDTIKALALDPKQDGLEEIQAKAQELIFAASQRGMEGDEAKNLLEVLNKCYLNLLRRREGHDASRGLSVLFPSIDDMTMGFKNKDLIILAARPSMGKTALALNMAVNVAKRNIPVLIFSLEMDDEQIGDRIVLGELFTHKEGGQYAVTSQEYQTRLSDEQFLLTQRVFSELYHLPVSMVDKRGLTVPEIRAKARKFKAEHPNLGLLVIDYLQLIKPPSNVNRNWTLIVGEMVRELRDLAGELNVPIILLSQLNRGVESRPNKRPLMSDLRDSGNIEEFADIVMFLYRDDYYQPELAKETGTEGLVEVIFAKQRKGPTGVVTLRFIKEYTRFIEEYSERQR